MKSQHGFVLPFVLLFSVVILWMTGDIFSYTYDVSSFIKTAKREISNHENNLYESFLSIKEDDYVDSTLCKEYPIQNIISTVSICAYKNRSNYPFYNYNTTFPSDDSCKNKGATDLTANIPDGPISSSTCVNPSFGSENFFTKSNIKLSSDVTITSTNSIYSLGTFESEKKLSILSNINIFAAGDVKIEKIYIPAFITVNLLSTANISVSKIEGSGILKTFSKANLEQSNLIPRKSFEIFSMTF